MFVTIISSFSYWMNHLQYMLYNPQVLNCGWLLFFLLKSFLIAAQCNWITKHTVNRERCMQDKHKRRFAILYLFYVSVVFAFVVCCSRKSQYHSHSPVSFLDNVDLSVVCLLFHFLSNWLQFQYIYTINRSVDFVSTLHQDVVTSLRFSLPKKIQ